MVKKKGLERFAYSNLSAMLLVLGDNLSTLGMEVLALVLAPLSFFTIFVIEKVAGDTFANSFVKAFAGMLIILVPTPVLGTIIGSGNLLYNLGGKK
jgi:hypothetical protein